VCHWKGPKKNILSYGCCSHPMEVSFWVPFLNNTSQNSHLFQGATPHQWPDSVVCFVSHRKGPKKNILSYGFCSHPVQVPFRVPFLNNTSQNSHLFRGATPHQWPNSVVRYVSHCEGPTKNISSYSCCSHPVNRKVFTIFSFIYIFMVFSFGSKIKGDTNCMKL
jgi:hypothetical protein